MKSKILGFAAAFVFSGLLAHAFPIAVAGTEGFSVIAGGGDPIIATYEGNSASYSNDLYLVGFGFVFNNHASAVGSTVNLGSYTAGTELIFQLHVNNTGYDFFTGDASRNPDNHVHARVQDNWAPGTTLVSFEDLFNGGFEYNDLSFSFTNTHSSGVPDGASTAGCLLLALAGMARFARRARA